MAKQFHFVCHFQSALFLTPIYFFFIKEKREEMKKSSKHFHCMQKNYYKMQNMPLDHNEESTLCIPSSPFKYEDQI